jgi:hypothetical protein
VIRIVFAMNKQRLDRLAQQKHRGSKRSYVTEIENLKIILAWQSGNLSEGQAARALCMDRVSLRVMRDDAIKRGTDLVEGY